MLSNTAEMSTLTSPSLTAQLSSRKPRKGRGAPRRGLDSPRAAGNGLKLVQFSHPGLTCGHRDSQGPMSVLQYLVMDHGPQDRAQLLITLSAMTVSVSDFGTRV